MKPSDGTPDYWINRWSEGRTAFHLPKVNPWLVEHAQRLTPDATRPTARGPEGHGRLLVPLCGKSVDLAWLEERGWNVVGVEIAEQPLKDFLKEQGRTAQERVQGPLHVFATGRIELWLGDFFALDPRRDGLFSAVWDRAALIALSPSVRVAYVRHLKTLLAPRARLLVVGLEYDAAKMSGPPYCVTRDEVRAAFADSATVELLGEKELIDEEPHFRDKGLDRITEFMMCVSMR